MATGTSVLQLILLLTAAITVGCEIWNSRPSKLMVGNDYVFYYDAQILTGVPTSSLHYTGYRLQAKVTLRMKDSTNMMFMRLSDIRFRQMQSEIQVAQPTVFLPDTVFQEMPQEKLMATELQRPFLFRWNNGGVSRVQVEVQDPVWSVNIKKGLLNMLNMELYTTRGSDEDLTKWSGGFRHSQFEEGIEGLCRSVYHWNRLPVATIWETDQFPSGDSIQQQKKFSRSADNVTLTLVKTRDVKNCLDAGVFEHSPLLYKDCMGQEINVSRRIIDAQVTTRANITYWRQSKEMFPWAIATDSRYTFPLIHTKMASIVTFVQQNFTFIDVKDTLGASLFGAGDSAWDQKSRGFQSENTLRLKTFLPEAQSSKNMSESMRTQLFEQLKKISMELQNRKQNQPQQPSSKPQPSNYTKLIRTWVPLLRLAPKSVLVEIHERSDKEGQEDFMMLFHDLLPFVATSEAMEVLLEKGVLAGRDKDSTYGEDSRVAGRVRNMALTSGFLHANAVRQLIQSIKQPVMLEQRRKETLKALILSIGTITRNIVERRKKTASPLPREPEDDPTQMKQLTMEFYQSMVKNRMPQFTEEEQLLLACKALGNLGMKESLPLLIDLIYERNTSVAVKVDATYAVRKMAARHRELVRRILMPNVYDVNQHVNIRIASYLMVMKTHPSEAELTALVEAVKRDPVEQVRTYVMSHLRSVRDRVVGMCDSMSVANISRVLETADFQVRQGLHQSRIMILPLVNAQYGKPRTNIPKASFGEGESMWKLLMYINTIWSQDDFLPQSADVRLVNQFSGIANEFVELGVRAEGLQKLLSQFIGPNGALYRANSLQEVLQLLSRSELFSKDVNIALYVNMFGEELAMWSLEEIFQRTLKNVALQGPSRLLQILSGNEALQMDWARTLYVDHMVQIPTTFGVPFQVNHTGVIHAEVQGQVQLKNKSPIHSVFNLKPQILTENFLDAGVDLSVAKTFTQIQVDASALENTHFKVNVRFDTQGPEGFRVHMENPDSEWDLLKFNLSLRSVQMQRQKSDESWTVQAKEMPLKFSGKQGLQRNIQTTRLDQAGFGWNLQTEQHQSGDLKMFASQGGVLRPWAMKASLVSYSKQQKIPGDGVEVQIPRLPPLKDILWNFNILCSRTPWKEQSISEELHAAFGEHEKIPTSFGNQDTEAKWLSSQRQGKESNYQPKSTSAISSFPILWNVQGMVKRRDTSSPDKETILDFLTKFRTNQPGRAYTLKASVDFKPRLGFKAQDPLEVQTEETSGQGPMKLNLTVFASGEENLKMLDVQITADSDPSTRHLVKAMVKRPDRFPGVQPEISICAKELAQSFYDTPACHAAWRRLNAFNRFNITLVSDPKVPVWLSASPLLSTYFQEFSWTVLGDMGDEVDVLPVTENSGQLNHKKLSLVVNPVDPRFARLNIWLNDSGAMLVGRKDMYLNVGQFPLLTSSVQTTNISQGLWSGVLNTLSDNHYPAICKVSWKTEKKTAFIQTFDRLFYHVGEWETNLGAEHLQKIILAQDVQNRFQLAYFYSGGKVVGFDLLIHGPGQPSTVLKRLTVVIQDSSGIFVNGNEIALPYSLIDENGNSLLQINRLTQQNMAGENEPRIVIGLSLLGVEVIFNLKDTVTLQVSPFYRSQLRGFCGDFNGETHQDLKDPDCRSFLLNPKIISHTQFGYVQRQPISSLKKMTGLDQLFLTLRSCPPKQQTKRTSPLLRPIRGL